jgi:hypothetical protein
MDGAMKLEMHLLLLAHGALGLTVLWTRVVASRRNITFHAEWNVDQNKMVRLILELMDVASDNNARWRASGLQPALRDIKWANGESGDMKVGFFDAILNSWLNQVHPLLHTDRHMRSTAFRLLWETRNVHFQAIWLQKKVRHNWNLYQGNYSVALIKQMLDSNGCVLNTTRCFINWAGLLVPLTNEPLLISW